MIVEPYKNYTINFIESLNKKEQAKCFRQIQLLEKFGFDLPQEYLKHIKDKIWELRIKCSNNQFRILYFTYEKDHVVLLNAFAKKSEKIPKKELEKANRIRKEYLSENRKYKRS